MGPSNPDQFDQHHSVEASFEFLPRFGVTGAQTVPAPTLDMSQLKLLVHWHNDTYKTFSRGEDTKHVWQVSVPEEALRNPFLMHGRIFHTLLFPEALECLTKLNVFCGVESRHEPALYVHAIEALRNLSASTYAQPTSLTLAVGWPIKIKPAYLDHVQMKEPFALVVLAYYCVFLHISGGNWCVGSWGKCVLRDIYHMLGSDWRAHIKWPVEEVFGNDIME
ncbi:hypothetical protein BBP40_002280 [Aspergillus hancockii]|nr:hypothetical protein BBP40_002280 [Aspergillus hancockii]